MGSELHPTPSDSTISSGVDLADESDCPQTALWAHFSRFSWGTTSRSSIQGYAIVCSNTIVFALWHTKCMAFFPASLNIPLKVSAYLFEIRGRAAPVFLKAG